METGTVQLTTVNDVRKYMAEFLGEREWQDIPEQEWRAFWAGLQKWNREQATDIDRWKLYTSTPIEAIQMVMLGFDSGNV